MSTVADPVIGREAELAVVARFLDELAGGPIAMVIEGEAGIGKTTVFREALAAAEDRGHRVLSARPTEGEAKLSYAALADLAGTAFDETRAALAAPQERALAAALLRAEAREPADPRTTATALVTVLTALAVEGPLLVAIDDVQWLDRASARALEFAARRLPPQLGVLVTRRTDGGSVPLGLDAALGPERVERLALGPLSLAAIHHVLKSRLGTAPSRPTLLRIEAASRGNPFYALEIARALEPAARVPLGEALPVPFDLGELIAVHVGDFPEKTREALLAAAALTRPSTMQIDAEALRPAEEAGVVRVTADVVEFSHPLLAAAVYAAAPAAERRRLHARLAADVHDLEERARHLALATVEPDEDVARVLDAGAARARVRGAPDAAGELLQEAARLTPSDAGSAGRVRLVRAAEAFFQAGDLRHAQVLLEQVLAATGSGPERGEALRLLGEMRYNDESFPEAIRLLEEALEHIDGPEVAVPIRLDLAFAFVSVGEIAKALTYVRTAVVEAQALGPGPLLGEALAVDVIVGFLHGDGLDEPKLARALELEDLDRPLRLLMRPTAIAAQIASYGDDLSEARARLLAIRDWALERGEDGELPFLLFYLALVEWRSGRYESTVRVTEEALAIAGLTGAETMRTVALMHRATARTFVGDIERARTDLEESRVLIERAGWKIASGWLAMAAGFLEITVGDPVAARRALAPLLDAVEEHGLSDVWFALFLCDAVEALVATEEVERADRLVDVVEECAQRFGLPWALAEAHRARSLALAARGDLDGALAAAGNALERARADQMPFYRARTLLVKGQVHRRKKEKRQAKDALEQALAAFEELGSHPWAQRARAELARLGLRASPTGVLTDAELRIAELAGAGRTNREVAQTLFISPKTVEATLSRVYGKLGIHSRAELGAWIASRE